MIRLVKILPEAETFYMSLFDKLPKIPFLSSNRSLNEYYFALNIGYKNIDAALWGIENNKLVLINSTSVSLKTGNLTEAANQALDEVLGDFQPEPTKVLFGVPDSWLQDDNLKEEHLGTLRDLVKELEVSPMAYISVSHALSHLLQKQQGIPITAILLGLFDPLNVTVVKAGKVIASKTVKRSGTLPEDIEKGLMAFSEVEVLPSKMLIYGSALEKESSEKLKDDMHSFPWMQNLPFLHLPKIEILKDEIGIFAVAFAGASEINPDVKFTEQSLEKLHHTQETNLAHKIDNLETVEEKAESKHPKKSEKDKSSLEDVGFMSGDIENVRAVEKGEIDQRNLVEPEHFKADEEEHPHKQKHLGLTKPYKLAANLFAPFNLILRRGGPVSLPGKKLFVFNKMIILPLLMLLFLLGAYFYFPKAKVTIFIDPRILEKDAQVTVDPAVNTVDETNKKIPGKIISINLSGSEKGSATGKKQIGDPAKGSVNVYNLTANRVTLSQGTVLSYSNGLKFVLDSTVQIASQSSSIGADFTTVTTPGKASSGVIAQSIGPEGNLAAGTNLSVANFPNSQVVAKVDSALSGGTSKDVTVVTNDDRKKLQALALSNLRKKAREELQAKLTGDDKILEEGLAEENVNSTFSKKVNDQASDFTVNLSVKFKGTSYKDSDLKAMVSKLVETNVPEGYTLNLSEAETQADVAKQEKDGKLIFLAKFRAKLLPKLDGEKIKSKIKGKTLTQAAQTLKNIENVISSEILIAPSMPSFLQRLPLLTEHISIEVRAK